MCFYLNISDLISVTIRSLIFFICNDSVVAPESITPLAATARGVWVKEEEECVETKLLTLCLRPYHDEHTCSRPITAVKYRRARIVLGWGTAWEHLVS